MKSPNGNSPLPPEILLQLLHNAKFISVSVSFIQPLSFTPSLRLFYTSRSTAKRWSSRQTAWRAIRPCVGRANSKETVWFVQEFHSISRIDSINLILCYKVSTRRKTYLQAVFWHLVWGSITSCLAPALSQQTPSFNRPQIFSKRNNASSRSSHLGRASPIV